jgi:PAS domain S-box-containing protein
MIDRSSVTIHVLTQCWERFNQIIDCSFDGIVVSDANGVVLHQNPAYEQITGLKFREMQNIVERICLMTNEPIIDISDIQRELKIGHMTNKPNRSIPSPIGKLNP